MKKTLLFLLNICLLFSVCVNGVAAESSLADEIERTATISRYFDYDEGYYTIELVDITTSEARSAKGTFVKSGSKTVTKYNSDDEMLWKYTLYGTFHVNEGVSSVCTRADYSTVIEQNSWSFSGCSAYEVGNTAHGVGTAKNKALGFIVIETFDIDIIISCDAYGNLS